MASNVYRDSAAQQTGLDMGPDGANGDEKIFGEAADLLLVKHTELEKEAEEETTEKAHREEE